MESKITGWYDLHCHVLPGIDDGCKTCEESIQVLQRSAEQGICGMVATPHYYPGETVSSFLKRRQEALQSLQDGLEKQHKTIMPLCLGAEVTYHSGLIHEEALEQLCFGKSRYLLLELPFVRWTPAVLRDVYAFRSVREITPIIAHLERYLNMQAKQTVRELLSMDVLIQINAETFLGVWNGRQMRKMLKRGAVQVLSSDCHDLIRRPPNLGIAVQQLDKKGTASALEAIRQRNQAIFEAALFGNEVLN